MPKLLDKVFTKISALLTNQKAMKRAPTSCAPLSNFLHLCGKGLGLHKSGSHTELRLLEEGAIEGSQASILVDAHTSTPGDWETGSSLYGLSDIQQTKQVESTQPSPSSETYEPHSPEPSEASEDVEAPQPLLYPTSTRVVLVHDRVAFALTKETVDDLHQVILNSRSLKHCQTEFEKAKRKADVGQSYIDMAESQINNSKLPDHFREQVKQDLEHCRAVILGDIQRKVDLEQELRIQSCNVELLRGDMDDLFERIMLDAGIIEEAEDNVSVQESQTDHCVAQANINDAEVSDYHRNEVEIEGVTEIGDLLQESKEASSDVQNELDAEESEMDIAEQEHTQAWKDLQEAGQLFEDREEAYKQDLAEYLDTGKYSRTQIDLIHCQRGATLTKKLREAEEAFERTRARCEALGIQINSSTAGSEVFFDDQGYRESQDPEQDTGSIDRDVIEAWVAQIAGAEEPHGEERPSPSSADIWDAESVNMSDSCSTLAHHPRERSLIQRWKKQQDLLREVVSMDASAD